MKHIRIRVLVIGLAAVFAAAATGAAIYVATGIFYPTAEGPYQVGRTKLFMTDRERPEIFTDAPDDPRELPVTIYYPAEPKDDDLRSTFAPPSIVDAIAAYDGCPGWALDSIRPNSFDDAAPVAGKAFPVLLFSGGLYGQFPFYGSLLSAVAAEGYIVVAVEHPYSEVATLNSAGETVRYTDNGTADYENETDQVKLEANANELCDVWTADMLYVFDHLGDLNAPGELLGGTMDIAKTGIFGHSFGGATALQCLQERSELLAGMNLDGSIYGKQKTTPVKQPFVFMMNEQEAMISAVCFRERVEASLTSEACYHMMVLGSTHDTFATDTGLLYDKYFFARPADAATVNGKQALSSITAYITAFFDRYILGEPSELLAAGYSSEYPDVISQKYKD